MSIQKTRPFWLIDALLPAIALAYSAAIIFEVFPVTSYGVEFLAYWMNLLVFAYLSARLCFGQNRTRLHVSVWKVLLLLPVLFSQSAIRSAWHMDQILVNTLKRLEIVAEYRLTVEDRSGGFDPSASYVLTFNQPLDVNAIFEASKPITNDAFSFYQRNQVAPITAADGFELHGDYEDGPDPSHCAILVNIDPNLREMRISISDF